MKKIIVANWKMNPQKPKEAERIFNYLLKNLKTKAKALVVVCPPFLYIEKLLNIKKKSRSKAVKLGAQNCFWEEKGAYTGEVSPNMLKAFGVEYVILGHSERRFILGENSQTISRKIKQAIKAGLTPILCIGEPREERKKGKAFQFLEKEIKSSLKGISLQEAKKVIIAYEPIWAIGTGNFCPADDALTVALFIKKVVSKKFGAKTAKSLKVLYGGSIDANNAKSYLKQEAISGLLVGSSSLKPKEFLKIIKTA